MDKERYISRIKKVTRLVLTGVVFGVAARAIDVARSDLVHEGSQRTVAERALSDPQRHEPMLNQTPIATQKPFPIASKADFVEQALQKYALELSETIARVEANPDVFNFEQDIEDLEIYYPIYRAAQEKYGVSWYLLWIIHQEESTVSLDQTAFIIDDETGQYGAMQRVTTLHFEENVAFASRGLEFLANLPQRHFDDWREIAWAAAKIKEDTASTGSVAGALRRYSRLDVAQSRYQRFLNLAGVFN